MSRKNSIQSHNYLHKPLGRYLIEAGLITEGNLFQALAEQEFTQQRIGNILVNKELISKNTLDYFVEKIIEPERIKESQKNILREENNEIPNNSQIVSDRLAKTLNVPTWEISPQKVTRTLLIVVVCLVLISSLAQFGAFFLNQSSSAGYSGRLFHLDKESNIPTLYSSLALAFCAILLGIISYMKKVMNANYVNYWKVLSFIFLWLAIDELCSIHEILNSLRPLLKTGGVFYFTWVVPGLIFVSIFLLTFWQFVKSLPPKTRSLFVMAGILYIGGAIGIEMIGGYYSEAYGQDNLFYSLIITIEESLEMLGIVVFIYALLSYITSHLKLINFRVSLQK